MRPTDESRGLALAVINDGEGQYGTSYKARLKIARERDEATKAYLWDQCARRAAKRLGQTYDYAARPVYTAHDILMCAVELNQYYREHVAESDAYDTAAGRGKR